MDLNATLHGYVSNILSFVTDISKLSLDKKESEQTLVLLAQTERL